jgi:hypothetical protein
LLVVQAITVLAVRAARLSAHRLVVIQEGLERSIALHLPLARVAAVQAVALVRVGAVAQLAACRASMERAAVAVVALVALASLRESALLVFRASSSSSGRRL